MKGKGIRIRCEESGVSALRERINSDEGKKMKVREGES
jgi:hypothetical protein